MLNIHAMNMYNMIRIFRKMINVRAKDESVRV